VSIFKYKRVITGEFPNTTTLEFKYNPPTQDTVNRPVYLAEVGGFQYVYIPELLVADIPMHIL